MSDQPQSVRQCAGCGKRADRCECNDARREAVRNKRLDAVERINRHFNFNGRPGGIEALAARGYDLGFDAGQAHEREQGEAERDRCREALKIVEAELEAGFEEGWITQSESSRLGSIIDTAL